VNSALLTAGLTGGAALAAAGAGTVALRRKGLHRWLGSYYRTRHHRRDRQPGEPTTVYLAVCDHFEPKRGGASPARARGRVRQWVDDYPRLFDRCRDSAGRPPQHTFFYPEDEYDPELVESVAGLCRRGYGDVEIHLHHDDDTADHFRETMTAFKTTLHDRHGLLRRDPVTGDITYGFIHGNWALDNARSDRRWCGVANELDILVETGCYADFTLPSAPSETQTSTINSVYWAVGRPGRSKSHDTGPPAGEGPRPDRGLLMVQGPLLLDWSRRKFGLMPAIENGNLQKSQPPSARRLALWLRAGVPHPHDPTGVVVKLHTHGVHEPNQDVLLGPPMLDLHAELARRAATDATFRYFYVTAHDLATSLLGTQPRAENASEDSGQLSESSLAGLRRTR
jgi:hypothetical protein